MRRPFRQIPHPRGPIESIGKRERQHMTVYFIICVLQPGNSGTPHFQPSAFASLDRAPHSRQLNSTSNADNGCSYPLRIFLAHQNPGRHAQTTSFIETGKPSNEVIRDSGVRIGAGASTSPMKDYKAELVRDIANGAF